MINHTLNTGSKTNQYTEFVLDKYIKTDAEQINIG